ncbi:MAG: choice-of-anchor Q domain-containing protein, partial [Planctomycetota bacterium]
KEVLELDRVCEDKPITFIESHNLAVVRKFPNDLQIWNTRDWTDNPDAYVDTTSSVMYAYYGWNGEYLAGTDGQGHFKLVNLKDLSVRRILAHEASKIGLAVSPTENYVATIGHGEVKLWDCGTGTEVANLFGHAPNRWMSFVGWSPTGKWLATTGWDQTVILWNVAERKMEKQLFGHQSIPRGLHFSQDESRLMSVGSNIKVWDTATGREILSFPNDQPHPSPDEFAKASVQDGFDLPESTLRFEGLKKLSELKRKNSQLDRFAHSSQLLLARKILFSHNPSDLDVQRSLSMAKQAVDLEPTSVTARLTLAYAYYRNKNTKAATVELDHVLRSEPDNIEAQLLECLLADANVGKLQEVFKRWSDIDNRLGNKAAQHLWTRVLRKSFPAREKSSNDPIIVNSLDDTIESQVDASPSLRRAILTAHPGDTIEVRAEGTIKLTYGQLVIDKPLTIIGPGVKRLTIDADMRSRIFLINDGNVKTQSKVAISNVRLINGRPPEDGGYNDWSHRGGAVFSLEALTLSECVLEMNHAQRGGALWIDEFSTTRMERCTFTNNTASNAGAAVCICGARWGRRATMIAEGCTFHANKAELVGGAIFSYGNLTMTNCTVHSNEAVTANAAGKWVGGGIACGDASGTAHLDHCTITDNLGGGAGFYRFDSVDLKGTNVEWPLRATVSNSIIYGNTKMGHPLDVAPVRKDTGNAINLSFSIIGAGTRFVDVKGNQVGVDPLLGALNDHGGPTLTRSPQKASPALDSAESSSIRERSSDFDQRGKPFVRVQNNRADIGAIERQQNDDE